jgi:hypothetical protein
MLACMDRSPYVPRLLKYLWASPCSAVGILVGAIPLLLGGQARINALVLEVTFRDCRQQCGRFARRMHFRGICFGHVILAVTREELQFIRAHERVHVEQYELWGILFFPAYLVSSLWQLLLGRKPYRDNWFEIQARRRSGEPDRRLTLPP